MTARRRATLTARVDAAISSAHDRGIPVAVRARCTDRSPGQYRCPERPPGWSRRPLAPRLLARALCAPAQAVEPLAPHWSGRWLPARTPAMQAQPSTMESVVDDGNCLLRAVLDREHRVLAQGLGHLWHPDEPIARVVAVKDIRRE